MAASAVGKQRVLLVGTGPTAACIYDLLRSHELAVQVIDKARGIGGRMSTSRSRVLGDRAAGTQPKADLGAQYITSSHPIVKKLATAGTLQPLTAPIQGQSEEQAAKSNWVAPHGISQIVRELFKGSAPLFEHHLSSLDVVDTETGKAWKATTQKGAEQDLPAAHATVLTLPAPQLLQLQGDVQDMLQSSGVAAKLQAVQYSARFALALWFAPDKAPAVAAAVPGGGMYVDRESGLDVRFIAHDTAKRGADVPAAEAGISLVVHSSVSFGKTHVEESKEHGGAILLEQVKQLLPGLPEADEVKHHKWRYSQVMTPYTDESAAGGAAIVLCEDPLLILAGDSFSTSNMDGCISSAEAAVALLSSKA